METGDEVAHRRARRAIVALCFPALFAILGIVSNYLRWRVFRNAQAGIFITQELALAHDARHAWIVRGQWATFLICGPLFLMWLHRAYGNLRTVKGLTTRVTPGWAVGYWFVPVVNLYRPYQIVKELWLKARSAVPSAPVSKIALWWTAYLGAAFVAQGSRSFALTAKGLADSITLAYMNGGSDALRLVAGLALMSIIHDVDTADADQRAAAP